MKGAIFSDFDETITRVNVTDVILERFADPSWLEIQEDWLAGRISARMVLQKQMPLIRASREELDAFIESIEVDPFFAEFALLCSEKHYPLFILSDGFDYWIEKILRRALRSYSSALKGLSLFSCHLVWEAGSPTISFPYFEDGCAHGCATCKVALFEQLKRGAESAIVIGDGISDLLLAQRAELVLAKNGLEAFCEREGIPYRSFRDFREVIQKIKILMEEGNA